MSWTKRLNAKMGRQSAKTNNKLVCSLLCLVAFALGAGLGRWPSRYPIMPRDEGVGPPRATEVRADFRVYPKPERLCLSAPYNACVDVAADPEHVYAELLKSCPDSGCTVLDIGANKGDFIEATLKVAPATKIVAFEPHPLLSQDLERRFGGAQNVKLYKAGLSIAPGKLHAAVSVGKSYQSVKFIKSCSDITELQKQRYNKTCQIIPTIALDDVVNFPVNIIKVRMNALLCAVCSVGRATVSRRSIPPARHLLRDPDSKTQLKNRNKLRLRLSAQKYPQKTPLKTTDAPPRSTFKDTSWTSFSAVFPSSCSTVLTLSSAS
jgi:FkbM family methyltransferase